MVATLVPYVRAMTTAAVAAIATICQELRGEHGQARRRVEVRRNVCRHRGAVPRHHLGIATVLRREPLGERHGDEIGAQIGHERDGTSVSTTGAAMWLRCGHPDMIEVTSTAKAHLGRQFTTHELGEAEWVIRLRQQGAGGAGL